MTDTFKPVQINEYFLKQIAAGLKKEIYDSLFKQIFAVLNDNSIYNDKNTLINAIRSGRIYYENGAFRSNKPFSNSVADELEKLGAKFKYGAYYIDRALLPVEIENSLAIVAARETAKIAALNGLLARLAATVGQETAVKLFIEKAVDRMFKKLQVDLEESTKERKVPVIDVSVNIPEIDIADTDFQKIDEYHQLTKEERKNLEVPKLNLDEVVIDKRAKKIAEDYTYNMDYWVKNWKAKEITVMRRDVLEMTQNGARTETIKKYFMNRWGIAERKAEFLARNESSIAGAVIKATHYQDMGCTHFKWLRSTSKEKRELHLEYAKETGNQYGLGGTNIFSFSDPPIIEQVELKGGGAVPKPDGQKGLPGMTYNCLPADARIISPFNNLRFYRRLYEGKLTSIVTSSKSVLKCTPNHPILTDKGWVGAGSLKIGDKIIKVKDDFVLSCTKYPQNTIPTIGELFDFFGIAFNSKRVTHSAGDFHGDTSIDQQVDVINIENGLFFDTETVVDEQIIEFIFTETEKMLGRLNVPCDSSFFKSLPFSRFVPNRYVSILDQLLSFFKSQSGIMDSTCFYCCSQIYIQACKSFGYGISCDSILLGEFFQAGARQIELGYRFCWELYTLLCSRWFDFKTIAADSSSQIMTFTALELGNFCQTKPLGVEFDTVLDKSESIFSSHIYNLENLNNWYLYHNYIIKNCSCNLVGIKNPQYYINRRKIENAKRTIFTEIKYAIENCKQCDNNPWRYRRFGEGA